MDFPTLMQTRRAVHHFLPGGGLTQTAYEALLRVVAHTPSGYNAQPWRFLLVTDPAVLAAVQAAAHDQSHITEAGSVVFILGDMHWQRAEKARILRQWREIRGLSDAQLQSLQASLEKERPEAQVREMTLRAAAMASMSFLLAVEDAGYASCPMMGFSQPRVRAILQLPERYLFGLMVAVGTADPEKTEPPLPRKDVSALCYSGLAEHD
ncbi:nitroreductase family protein [Candidatus Peribacteria bacterium]|nr:nitroreductase family protein [Candidatus Peribacteria bacterium]